MSVIASSISGLSSILKSPGIRSRNAEQRVRFRLPESLKTVLLDFINRENIKLYEELIYAIRDGDVDVSILRQEVIRDVICWFVRVSSWRKTS